MSYLKDTPKLVHNTLRLTSQIIESDTEVSVIDLNLLENLNTNQSLNYIKLEQTLNNLEKNAKEYEHEKMVMDSFGKQLDGIESKLDKIENITKELDQWSKELEADTKK